VRLEVYNARTGRLRRVIAIERKALHDQGEDIVAGGDNIADLGQIDSRLKAVLTLPTRVLRIT
jgi:hypothetical protein